nr:MAG TPA: hypothetical protein [Caudoviricetes sp.]
MVGSTNPKSAPALCSNPEEERTNGSKSAVSQFVNTRPSTSRPHSPKPYINHLAGLRVLSSSILFIYS